MKFLGVDTGGTFTDFVLYDGGALRIHKVLSTPQAPEQASLQGIRELGLESAGLAIVHGSTVATNAALEGRGVRTVYITNHGLGDVLTIGRQAGRDAWTPGSPAALAPGLDATSAYGLLVALAIAQVGSLFSSDAWNNITFTAGEVKNPPATYRCHSRSAPAS